MSCGSDLSEISVSINGIDTDLESMLSQTFKDLQQHLNDSQLGIRTLGTLVDREDCTLHDAVLHQDALEDSVDEIIELFKDLKDIVKQISPTPFDNDEKDWLRVHKAERKEYKKKKKIEEKEEAKLNSIQE